MKNRRIEEMGKKGSTKRRNVIKNGVWPRARIRRKFGGWEGGGLVMAQRKAADELKFYMNSALESAFVAMKERENSVKMHYLYSE